MYLAQGIKLRSQSRVGDRARLELPLIAKLRWDAMAIHSWKHCVLRNRHAFVDCVLSPLCGWRKGSIGQGLSFQPPWKPVRFRGSGTLEFK